MKLYARAAILAIAAAPFVALAMWNTAATLRRWAARRSLARALAFDIAGCLFVALAAGCLSPDAETCPAADAGVADAPATYAHCTAPPHGVTYVVAEPDGSLTCLWGGCEIGWADCDGNPENGCEAWLLDIHSCGVCGRKCPVEMACAGAPGIEIRCVPEP